LFILIFTRKITTRKVCAKNASAYKPNQQVSGKEGKGKKRNDSEILFEQA